MPLAAVDANLVVALDALLRERSVTRAARRVGLSQPAMSHALSRLRGVLEDPLLVREGQRMELTERAKALAAPVAAVVRDLDALFREPPPPFDPAKTTQRFRLSATGYVQVILLGQLQARLARQAPLATLEVQRVVGPAALEALQLGALDVALGVFPPASLPTWIKRRELFDDRFIGLARASHARARGQLDWRKFAKLQHVAISQGGIDEGVCDGLLKGQGEDREIALTLPDVMMAPHVVAGSDLVVAVAERLGRAFSPMLPLRTFQLPVALLEISVAMVWHARTDSDPALTWFRRQVAQSTRFSQIPRREELRTEG